MVSLHFVTNSSGNNQLPDWHQAITWINADLLSINPFRKKLSKIKTIQLSFQQKIYMKMLSAKCQPFCLGLNALKFTEQLHLSTAGV